MNDTQDRGVARRTTSQLSPREREVLEHVSNGLTYGQIAHRMGVSHYTVDTYLHRIRVKTGATSTAQLTRLAMHLHSALPDGQRPAI
jgi:DNA-binding CsgD family transcriptional regulator